MNSGLRWPARPDAKPFTGRADREAWREHVESGWWRRLVHARASAEIARCIFPHLTTKGLAPWTKDFLTVIWLNSLDRVVLTDIDVLWRRTDVHSFKALKEDLHRWCRGDSWRKWSTYLDAVVMEAQASETFRKAKRIRDVLIAHRSLDPLRGVTGDPRLTMEGILKLQDLTEEVFALFPGGPIWRIKPAVASRYPSLVERIVKGDVRS